MYLRPLLSWCVCEFFFLPLFSSNQVFGFIEAFEFTFRVPTIFFREKRDFRKKNGEPHNSHLHHTLLLHLHQPKKAVRNREVRREIESTRRRFTSFVFILFACVFVCVRVGKKEREISFRFPSFTNRIVCFSSSFFSVVVVVALCSLSLSLSLRNE